MPVMETTTMSDYSINDWRYYSEAELEHGWGDSPEQKKESENTTISTG